MASGRVGGTRSKIRGQVGDVIYQVVRNADGTYTQISYGKAENVTNTITPRLQAQRMCTSMVEALMRDLRPVATISMQSAANKSKSLNAFSSYNVQLVARDCQANWYSGNKFYYPRTGNLGTPSEQMGGLYMISSGTWQFNGFDAVVHLVRPERVWPYARFIGKRFAGLMFALKPAGETVELFLRRHYMTPLDGLVFCCFHDWIDSDADPDDPVYCTRHSYVLMQFDTTIDLSAQISPELLKSMFIVDSDWEVFQEVSDDGTAFYIGLLIDNDNDGAYFYTYGGFSISYMEGKKKVSSSFFKSVEGDAANYFSGQAPADVFGTWMGEPRRIPYPSPFV